MAWWRGGVIFRPSVKCTAVRFELSEHAFCTTKDDNSAHIATGASLLGPCQHATMPRAVTELSRSRRHTVYDGGQRRPIDASAARTPAGAHFLRHDCRKPSPRAQGNVTRHLVRARLDGPRAHPSKPSDDRKQWRIAFKRRRVAKTSCGEAVGVLGTKSMLAKARGRAPPSPKARPACPQRPSCREFGLETGGAMRSVVRTPPCEQGTRGMSRG